ncbi:SDR family NAD(P)-dependent oxidoreductase [Calothrix sp. 336/3]|uniref:SDR family NAD(P)-dependent oxidoreductase n=1 Tax=Calothrix sp. 336/3 TaxID=1337936 RepID=UPI0004E30B1E|nr:glucose 1-dehydrogenase [Calothrix sp. 336/3]AKG19958.1 short-chain dehydrogenase [Calothrix sp. 336/3]
MDRVKDKVVIVTGAALGIGRATSLLLAKEGAKVAVTDIRHDEGKALVEEIQEQNGEAVYWHLDVSQEPQVQQVVGEVAKKWGRVDVLVNNAGISGVNKPTHKITQEEWNAVMAINVNGVFLCTKHVIPLMLSGGGGSIINISAVYGLVGSPSVPPYHASKGAVRLMSKTDAVLYAANNIRVNSVHPGFIWTPMIEDAFKKQGLPQQGRKYLDSLHPLGHMGEPEDVAYGILYLASDESKFVTGTELVIDGGYTAR